MPNYLLRNGDCLGITPQMRPACVDMIFADLPYGTTQNAWDTPLPFGPMWEAFNHVAKPNAAIVLMAAQPFASQLVCSNPKHFRYDLIWRKNKSTGFLNAKRMPLRAHEHILVFYREAPTYNPQKTNGHEPGHKATRAKKSTNYGDYRSTDYGGSTERYPTSVLDIPILNNDSPDKVHATQKPVDLVRWFVRSYTNPGAIVLDPTMGVGTTGIAALQEGRGFIGIEKHEEFYREAERRLSTL